MKSLCIFRYVHFRKELNQQQVGRGYWKNNGIVVEEKFVSYLESIARLISKHLLSTPTFTKVSPRQI